MKQAEERRRKRSNDPLVALHYQLASARQEGRLDAIVVADDGGLVVAAAGSWAVCEELAAYAPLIARSESDVPSASRIAEMRAKVDIKAVDVDGQTVLVCSQGGKKPGGVTDSAARAVERILRQAA
jgi:hypothetical protein